MDAWSTKEHRWNLERGQYDRGDHDDLVFIAVVHENPKEDSCGTLPRHNKMHGGKIQFVRLCEVSLDNPS
tara:strand:- start:176924 stop:177133 length:210 start_codon:yes stop_codon:yes gene_type:complete